MLPPLMAVDQTVLVEPVVAVYLELKLNKRAMAKVLDVSPNMLYQWLLRRRPEVLGE